MARHLMVVFGSAKPGIEAEYNAWYDSVHIPQVLKVPGFVAGQRFDVVQRRPEETTRDYGYMALYEIESDDVHATIGLMRAGIAAGEIDTGNMHQPDMLGFYIMTAGSPRLMPV